MFVSSIKGFPEFSNFTASTQQVGGIHYYYDSNYRFFECLMQTINKELLVVIADLEI